MSKKIIRKAIYVVETLLVITLTLYLISFVFEHYIYDAQAATQPDDLSREGQIQLMKQCMNDAKGKWSFYGQQTPIVVSNIATAFFEYRTRNR